VKIFEDFLISYIHNNVVQYCSKAFPPKSQGARLVVVLSQENMP
jgi:hypothetical protein